MCEKTANARSGVNKSKSDMTEEVRKRSAQSAGDFVLAVLFEDETKLFCGAHLERMHVTNYRHERRVVAMEKALEFIIIALFVYSGDSIYLKLGFMRLRL
jgi:hypothetical protein